MTEIRKKGFPAIGLAFLALGLFNFVRGENWVVWIILGLLFGGLGSIGRGKTPDPS